MIESLSVIILLAVCGAEGISDVTEAADLSDVLCSEDFSEVEMGAVPEDFMVLDGDFSVVELDGNRLLELPGAPLSTFVLLAGPSEPDELRISARIYGESTKRRMPRFGVGLNGISGYQLRLAPSKRKLELTKQNDVVSSVAFKWVPGTWTTFLLQVRRAGEGDWMVEGKAWPVGKDEPQEWMIQFKEPNEPLVGRPALWGTPYSGKAIRYDDLEIARAVKSR